MSFVLLMQPRQRTQAESILSSCARQMGRMRLVSIKTKLQGQHDCANRERSNLEIALTIYTLAWKRLQNMRLILPSERYRIMSSYRDLYDTHTAGPFDIFVSVNAPAVSPSLTVQNWLRTWRGEAHAYTHGFWLMSAAHTCWTSEKGCLSYLRSLL